MQYLVATGQKVQAETLIADLRGRLTSAQALYVLPYCEELTGHPEAVHHHFDAALAAADTPGMMLRAAADFYLRHSQFARAMPHLRRLLEIQTAAATADVQWARRQLAIGLALSGSYASYEEALSLLQQNSRDTDGATIEDQRARAVVLGQQPSSRAAAIALLEALQQRKALTLTERFLLVQLYDADRDATHARRHLADLLAAPQGKTPATLAYAIRDRLRHREFKEAQALLVELQELEPNAFLTITMQAAVFQARGLGAQAVQILETFARRKDADLVEVAAALEELGQVAAADGMYRRHFAAQPQPEALLARARFLGRQKRVAEALALCEQAGQSAPNAAAPVCVAVLHAASATPADCQRVADWLTAKLAESPDALPLRLALAEVRDRQGRYVDAIACYRAVLANQQDHVVALNNLAWLLAWDKNTQGEALKLVDRAIRIGGPAASLLDTRAVVYLASGAARPAVPDLEQATAQRPTAARCFHLACAYALAGKTEEAMESLEEAQWLDLTPEQLHPLDQPSYEALLAILGQQ